MNSTNEGVVLRIIRLNAKKVLLSGYVIAGLFYLVLAMHIPVSLSVYSTHDDALFWNRAYPVLTGNWLGVFNNLTFAKGPGFTLFESFNALTGLPITFTLAALYIGATGLLVHKLSGIIHSETLKLALFVFFMIQPGLFPGRIIRDYFYVSILLLILAGLTALFSQSRPMGGLKWNVALGALLGVFFITREESIWILPGTLLVFAYLGAKYFRSKKRIFIKTSTVVLLSSLVAPLVTSSINLAYYGVFRVTDSNSGPFDRALSNLQSVMVGEKEPYLPVPAKVREAIYEESPSFATLKGYFDGPGMGWTEHGCNFYANTCGDYAGGWFMWALRAAAASEGNYSSARAADDFFNKIADEVSDACNAERLKCQDSGIPFVPNFVEGDFERALAAFGRATQVSFYQDGSKDLESVSEGPLGALNLVRAFLGNPRSYPSEQEQSGSINGWYISGDEKWIYLQCLSERREIIRKASPDVEAAFPKQNSKDSRFGFEYPVGNSCGLYSSDGTELIQELDSLENLTGYSKTVGQGVLQIDSVFRPEYQLSWNLPLSIKSGLYDLQRHVIIWVSIIGIAFALFFTLRNARRMEAREILSLSIASMIFVRLIVVSVIDATYFPAVNSLYLAPNFALIPILSAIGLSYIFEMRKKNAK